MIYSSCLYLISDAFIRERMTGLVDRNLVAGTVLPPLISYICIRFDSNFKKIGYIFFSGVQMNEIFIGYLIKEAITMVCQTALVYVVFLLICKVPCLGSVTLALFITFLQGFAGLCFGNK